MEDVYRLYKAQHYHPKDHFPIPFIDLMLERLARHSFCYLDGHSIFFQIPIHFNDQEDEFYMPLRHF